MAAAEDKPKLFSQVDDQELPSRGPIFFLGHYYYHWLSFQDFYGLFGT